MALGRTATIVPKPFADPAIKRRGIFDMKTMMVAALRAALVTTTILRSAAALTTAATAQTTTASIRGQVRDAAGAAVAGATVVAVNTSTNQTFRATSSANGSYILNGLRPAPYTITVTGPNGDVSVQRISVGVGQSATLDAVLARAVAAPAEQPDATAGGTSTDSGEVVVTAGRLVETKTSEVATNVSQAQIRILPQGDRNFLTFAALAPGVRYNDSETNKGITAGASPASQVNVFIDGTSLKSQTLGGIAGQTDSRGNPFGQLAVGEFRVLTQNYKAEYEQAGSAIVTAITKSGTNEFHGEMFGQYTDRSLTAANILDERAGRDKPKFERKQYGVSLGGPIIKDKLFFFGAYEGNDQDRASSVVVGQRTPENVVRFGQYEGTYVSPYRGDFYFGKLTFTPDERQVFDLSFSRREETDVSGFGANFGSANIAYSAAVNKINKTDTYTYKWTYTGDSFVNEANLTYLDAVYNPSSLNPDDPSFEYQGVITFGGKDSTQRISQQSYVLRDDLTYNGLQNHAIKGGLRFAFQDYDFTKNFFVQPRYFFQSDAIKGLDFSFPAQAQLGVGNPRIIASNSQLGAYIQDDWDVTDKLQINVGLRWDYESNLFNNNYRTPAAAIATLNALPKTDYFDPANYITDGTDRPTRKDMFQPRIGFSYDVNDDQRTVIFGGYGKYYDRNVFNNTLDEQFRLQYQTGIFNFSRDGLPRDGNPTVQWDPQYLTRDGLLALRDSAQTGQPDLFAVKNDAKAPSTDQFSFGLRQKFGVFRASLTGSYVRGQNGYTHLFATRNADGSCCDTTIPRANGFGNVLIGYDGLRTRYKALLVTIDKDYTVSSGWGFNLAYTLSKAEQDGGDLFSLDKVTPDKYGWRPIAGQDERHRIVLSGIADLPLGFQFSTLTTLGSGTAFQLFDRSAGVGINQQVVRSLYRPKNCLGSVFAFCEVNLTLQNNIKVFSTHNINVAVDLLNAFNNKNYDGYSGNLGVGETYSFDRTTNAPTNLLTLPRRIQFRVGYRF
ncbi:TonB-dependent receptor [Sphingomonas sp. ZB1N12]|uniref:TonB-dependent receptor n=1 Tax=Sphingomonas arabinosi TaxID=3096160 RepID=UPI002FC9D5B7